MQKSKLILTIICLMLSTQVMAYGVPREPATVDLVFSMDNVIMVCHIAALISAITGFYQLVRYSLLRRPKALRNSIILICIALVFLAMPGLVKSYKSFKSHREWAALPKVNPIYTQAVVENTDCLKIPFPSSYVYTLPEGITTIAFIIDDKGNVTGGQIVNSSGNQALDNAAIEGLRKCKFHTAEIETYKAYSWTVFQYIWKRDTNANVNPLVPLPQGNYKMPDANSALFYEELPALVEGVT